MLAGLEKLDSGEIIHNGESVSISHLEDANLLGFVFQDFQLFPHLSVMDNLILSPTKTLNMSKKEAQDKALHLLERLGLAGFADAYPTRSQVVKTTCSLGPCHDDRPTDHRL